MPKPRAVCHPEPTDDFVLFRIKWDTKCGKCGAWLFVGRSKAWWRPGEKKVYCGNCIGHRTSEQGRAEAVLNRLLGK